MHEFITTVASLIIFSLMISQFTASENLYLETVEIVHTVDRCEELEYEEAEIPDKKKELAKELNMIPNTSARPTEDGVRITITNIIGPFRTCGITDNSITIDKRINFKIKEKADEKPDNDSGFTDTDGSP